MPTPLRVLFVEDTPEDANLLLRELRRAGFEPASQRVETQADYLADALRLLRQRSADVPFLMVSGTTSEDVVLTALREGAAEYLHKNRLTHLGSAVRRALAQRQQRGAQR